jgi:hypothetical protein
MHTTVELQSGRPLRSLWVSLPLVPLAAIASADPGPGYARYIRRKTCLSEIPADNAESEVRGHEAPGNLSFHQ